MYLTGERRACRAMLQKELCRATEFSQTEPLENVADFGERRIRMIEHAQTYDALLRAFERFRENNGIASPTGDKSNAFELVGINGRRLISVRHANRRATRRR